MLSCLNCNASLSSTARFCAQCGQKAQTRRLTLHDFGHELWHALTHTDHSALSLVKALLTRPGQVAREYVQGARKRYFNPFTFMVVCIGLNVLLVVATGIGGFANQPGKVGQALQNHTNWVFLAQVPVLALWQRLLQSGGLNLSEHLVLAAYSSGMRSLYYVLVIVPTALVQTLLNWGLPYWPQVIFHIVVWVIYYGWANAQFQNQTQRRWVSAALGMLAALLTQATSFALIWIAFWAEGSAR